MGIKRFDHKNSFINAIKTGVNLFAGAGFSIYAEDSQGKKLPLGRDSRFNFQSDDLFFTFNYTDTLETVYGIEEKNINHIHGNRLKGEEPVLGFGSDCEHIFEPSESDTTYEDNSYQFICEVANEEEKDTASIIALNEKYGYWKTLNGIDYVIVIGHSYSTVDISYFDKISHSVSVGAKWHLYCYTAEDRCRATEMMKIIGVSKYELL